MAISNLGEMAKADRYTADGREAIAKAREADVEDRTYQIGEISQKTGLQKTAEGWVKPKGGNSAGGAKKEEKHSLENAKRDEELHRQRAEGEANAEAYRKRYEEEHMETSKKNEIKEIAYKDGSKKYYPEGTQFYFDTPEKAESVLVTNGRGGTKTYANPSKNPEINSLQRTLGFSIDASGGKYSMDDFIEKIAPNEYAAEMWSSGGNTKKTLLSPFPETGEERNIRIKKNGNKWNVIYTERGSGKQINIPTTKDSAPRQLTGDCKITIKG